MATSNNIEVKPDHIIIWLDKNMGQSRNNRPSKTDLSKNANLDCLPSNERSYDIDNFICNIDLNMNNEQWNNLINNVLKMFTNVEECIKFIDDNLKENKKLFLIASGQMGALIVSKIHKKLSGSIYIFCGQRNLHEEWTCQYDKDIEIYDDETGVFAKVLSDIGIHYYLKTEDDSLNRTSAIKYLCWARQFFIRASELDHAKRDDYLKMVDEKLTELESSQSNNDTNNDDGKNETGKPPGEN